MPILILIMLAAGAAALLFASQTPESVALVGIACLFAILARIVRASQPLKSRD